MGENKPENSIGCLILTVLGVIGIIVYTISEQSTESLKSIGIGVFSLIFLFVISLLFNNRKPNRSQINNLSTESNYTDEQKEQSDDSDKKFMFGCLKVILAVIVIGVVFSVIANSDQLMIGLGITAVVALCIGIGVWVWNAGNGK